MGVTVESPWFVVAASSKLMILPDEAANEACVAGFVIPAIVNDPIAPLAKLQPLGRVIATVPVPTVTSALGNTSPDTQVPPKLADVEVTTGVAGMTKVLVAVSKVTVIVLRAASAFALVPLPFVKLTVQVETAEAAVEPGVIVTVLGVALPLALAGAAKSVRPPRIKAALSAPFIHT